MKTDKEGSRIAKEGFKNEDDVVYRFNHWKTQKIAQDWLIAMGYNLGEIERVVAEKIIGHYKADIQVCVSIVLKKTFDVENLQIKLVSNPKGFNQIDKRWVDNYAQLWDMPEDIVSILKRYTGEHSPSIATVRDKRRMFMDEFSSEEQQRLLRWLENNRILIVSDILKGRGKFTAEWMLVINKTNKLRQWVLHPMNLCMGVFGRGVVGITSRGSIKLGEITIQRKGGDAGRRSANMLQFKINPMILFDIDNNK